MHLFLACTLLAGVAVYTNARPASADVAQSFNPSDLGKSSLKHRKVYKEKRPDPMEKVDDEMAAIIFDRTIKADEKWAKLQKLSGAEDDTPETNEKEKAFLIKLDKFFEFYDKEILAKATPKVKAMLGQLEEMFKHPSQMDKMSDDTITNKIQQMTGDMDTTDQLNLMSSIIKIHERLEKDGILKELEDLADEAT